MDKGHKIGLLEIPARFQEEDCIVKEMNLNMHVSKMH